MKFLFTIVSFIFSLGITAQSSEKFQKAMQANLAIMDSSFKSPSGMQALSNSFERIAQAEKKEWLPYYYAALLQVNLGFQQQDKSLVDAIADRAEVLINKADSLSPENSEICCIKSMIASCRLMVDPMNRYMKYGQVSSGLLEQAIKLDPSNPRPYLLKGQSLKYTPEQFGGGCKTATPLLETAAEKFISFTPASPIHPNWGAGMNANVLAECKH